MPTQRERELHAEWILTRDRLTAHIEHLQVLLAARRAGKASEAATRDLVVLRRWREELDETAIEFLMPE
jgi:hypothetical protein